MTEFNEVIKKHIINYNSKKGYGIEEEDLIEVITDATILYEEVIDRRRHWNDTFRVCKIDGLLIGYNYADSTGDMGLYDLGWEFDISSICEVIEEKIIKTIYKPKD